MADLDPAERYLVDSADAGDAAAPVLGRAPAIRDQSCDQDDGDHD